MFYKFWWFWGWICGCVVRIKGVAFGFGCAQGDYSRAILRVVVAQGAWLRMWRARVAFK